MAVTSINIVIEQGVDYEKSFPITETDGSISDLNGKTATAAIKKHPGSDTSVSFTTGISTVTGIVTVSMASSVTDTLDEGRYLYDIILTDDGTGKKEKPVTGMVIVNPSITV